MSLILRSKTNMREKFTLYVLVFDSTVGAAIVFVRYMPRGRNLRGKEYLYGLQIVDRTTNRWLQLLSQMSM